MAHTAGARKKGSPHAESTGFIGLSTISSSTCSIYVSSCSCSCSGSGLAGVVCTSCNMDMPRFCLSSRAPLVEPSPCYQLSRGGCHRIRSGFTIWHEAHILDRTRGIPNVPSVHGIVSNGAKTGVILSYEGTPVPNFACLTLKQKHQLRQTILSLHDRGIHHHDVREENVVVN
ncbi:hypothetical protein R3P38DRAFT_3086761, partial [Favolaschia claudopus]